MRSCLDTEATIAWGPALVCQRGWWIQGGDADGWLSAAAPEGEDDRRRLPASVLEQWKGELEDRFGLVLRHD